MLKYLHFPNKIKCTITHFKKCYGIFFQMLLIVNPIVGYVIFSPDFLLVIKQSNDNSSDSKVSYQVLPQAGFSWESFH